MKKEEKSNQINVYHREFETNSLDKTLQELIEESVLRNQDNVAVIMEGRTLKYEELNERANKLAWYMRSIGVGPNNLVAVVMERSLEMIVSLVAILKAGGAYLPIDPKYPFDRIAFILQDADVSCVLIQENLEEMFSEYDATVVCVDRESSYISKQKKENPSIINSIEDTAYVIYTSGSTGKPKGCMVPHKAITNRLLWMKNEYQVEVTDKILQKTPYTFDVSVWELFLPLISGAVLCFAKPEGHKDSDYLVELIKSEQITICHFVPSMLRFFISNSNSNECTSLRCVVTSGEALGYDLVKEFKQKLPKADLNNLYGPTEAAVDVSYWNCVLREDKIVPIGVPIWNVDLYILDEEQKIVPDGQEGELYIGGICLAKGYLNRPDLTKDRFIKNPFSSNEDSRLYKTGDKVRLLEDGNIQYIGRLDFQVKLRGNRVELGEIEEVLRGHDMVKDVVVDVKDQDTQDPKLVAYIVAEGEVPGIAEIRKFAKTKLPDYMLPNIVCQIEEIPVTLHGKLDKKSLPWPIKNVKQTKKQTGVKTQDTKVQYATVEKFVADEVGKALMQDNIGTEEDLFDLGATSLTMVQIVQNIKEKFGVVIPIEVFLEEPSIKVMTDYVSQELSKSSDYTEVKKEEREAKVTSTQQETTETKSEVVIPLHHAVFQDKFYKTDFNRETFQKGTIPFHEFSKFMMRLKQESVGEVQKYLYPSAGGLNANQTYVYVKKGTIEGIEEGIYYYHPEEHKLYLIGNEEINRDIFFEQDRVLYENAGFAIFIIAQLDAVEAVYHSTSPILVTLDAGYMGNLMLMSDETTCIRTHSVVGVDFEEVIGKFQLGNNQRFIHCLLGGVANNKPSELSRKEYINENSIRHTKHFKNYSESKGFHQFLSNNMTENIRKMKFLNKQEHDQFVEAKHHIRKFDKDAASISLDLVSFDKNDYLLRSSQREYEKRPIPFENFSRFMSMMAERCVGNSVERIYPSVSECYCIKPYFYIKPNGVEGISEGIYYYDAQRHALIAVTLELTKRVKLSFTPFNRKHYEQSQFIMFMIADLAELHQLYGSDDTYLAYLDAGYLGQTLTSRQAEFDIGICPIGGIEFSKISDDFKLKDSQLLLHSYTCGNVIQTIPANRTCLEVREETTVKQDEIAIVGLAGRFPGAENIEEYWDALAHGEIKFTDLPDSRKKEWEAFLSAEKMKDIVPKGGYLKDIESFDNLLFNITPAEARTMDPQERIFMEVVWECLEDAGYTAKAIQEQREKVGVFVGAMWNDYQGNSMNITQERVGVQAQSLHSSIANRVSYYFNFSGPSIALNTSCSSGMTALHLACESIRKHECDIAIVGGINLITHPYHLDMLKQLSLTSKNGECHGLGADATGWVPGEAAGALIIRRLEDSKENRDHIYGIVKGSAIGHSGRASRFGAPSSKNQEEAMRCALENSGLNADSIQYVESGAAGASISDASEVEAITRIFSETKREKPCLIGTVKNNIGHSESASSLTQIAKVLLEMKHEMIAPTVEFIPVNPFIDLNSGTIRIVDELEDWDTFGQPMRALVNSCGATGSSGHVVLESYQETELGKQKGSEVVIPISAYTEKQAKEYIDRLLVYLEKNEDQDIEDIGYTLQVGRTEMAYRIAFVARNMEDCKHKLKRALILKESSEDIFIGDGVETGKEISQAKELMEVAKDWVAGMKISWKQYHSSQERKVSLPTYCFRKNPFWIGINEKHQSYKTEEQKNENGLDTLVEKADLYLKKLYSAVSEIEEEFIKPKIALDKYGLNSMIITKLNHILEEDFEKELPKTLFFEYQTLHELAEYFVSNHQADLKKVLCKRGLLSEEYCACESINNSDLDSNISNVTSTSVKEVYNGDIAIVGLDGKFANSPDIKTFWNNLKNGVDCIVEVPGDRWDHSKYYSEDRKASGKTYGKWGGFLTDIDKFDPLFFGISPREAERMDPQERLFLESVWHVFEDAGYNRESLVNCFHGNIGVYVGVMYGEYQLLNGKDDRLSILSSYGSIANRVSYYFDFHGPSMAIDTLCSSSLTALHLAIQSIQSGDCEAAVVGGVNINVSPVKYLAHAQLNMISSDGRCHSYGEGGDGFVQGEGVGSILIKPLDKARKDHDHIYGVIKATALNHGGKTNGYTVPNPNSQSKLVDKALEKANIHARTMSYIEGHGTGTSLGDPIEITALTKSFRRHTQDKQFCAIGSVKSNIGHTEGAAGIAGIAKVLLQMKHKKIVPSLYSKTLNQNIDFSNTPFYVPQTLQDWEQPEIMEDGKRKTYPRRAGISSFGAGGTNVHVIIEECERATMRRRKGDKQALIFSARNKDSLKETLSKFADDIQDGSLTEDAFDDMVYTLQVGREPLAERIAFLASSLEEVRQTLEEYLKGNEQVVKSSNMKNKQKNPYGEVVQFVMTEQVAKQIEERDMEGLMNSWLDGAYVKWDALYEGEEVYKLSLPTYSFAKQRYWVTIPEEKSVETQCHVQNDENVEIIQQEKYIQNASVQTKDVASEIVYLQSDWKENLPAEGKGDFTKNIVILCDMKQNIGNEMNELFTREGKNGKIYTVSTFVRNAGERYLNYANQIFEILKDLNDKTAGERTVVQIIMRKTKNAHLYGGLSCMLSTLQMENAMIDGQMIFVEQKEDANSIWKKMQENLSYTMDKVVSYENGVRYAQSWKAIADIHDTAVKPWKENGTYLIVGGTGKLGALFAEEIAKSTGKVNLVITGTKEISDKTEEELKYLESIGGNAVYKMVDVTKKNDVRNMIDQVKAQIGTINGVIFCAGINHDAVLQNKTQEEFESVMKVKVLGAEMIDLCTRDIPLDFMVLFSSITRLNGNPGQIDYTAANAFLDNYAAYRNELVKQGICSGHTISIAWPFWKNGGMELSKETEDFMLHRMNLVPMQNEDGLQAFYNSMQLKESMVGILNTKKQKNSHVQSPKVETKKVARKVIKVQNDAVILNEVREELTQNIQNILKVNRRDIDLYTPLSDYGFDSISLTEFINALNLKYNLDLTPAVFYERSTLDDFSNYLLEEYKDIISGFYSVETIEEELVEEDLVEEKELEEETLGSKDFVEIHTNTFVEKKEPIAIVGISGVFPECKDVDELWENLVTGKDCIREIPKDRWDWREFYGDPINEPNKTNIKWGGFIDSVDEFDPLFFGISPKEATYMDPQQRLLMTYVWKVIEDAGYSPKTLGGTQTGLFVGTASTGYNELISNSGSMHDGYTSTGAVSSMGPNRMSYFLDIHGPSEPIETACSSSLIAVSRGVEAIQNGSCDMAIAGGVNTIITPMTHMVLNKAGVLSEDGHCKTFSERADGYVRGEGVGMVFLKRLSKAKEDRDHIYGVILGAAENHGGRAASLTAPNPNAQAEVIKAAYKKAGIDPTTVSYIETHGTGTALGDPIEINGLKKAFQEMTDGHNTMHNYCGIGSVKSNIGHLELAAGIAGLIKILLQMKHNTLVKNLNCKPLNPYISLKDSPFYIVEENQEWKTGLDKNGQRLPRRASISSFGFGGSNVHVVLEEYQEDCKNGKVMNEQMIFVFSGKNMERLKDNVDQFIQYAKKNNLGNQELLNIAYTLSAGRNAMCTRLAVIDKSMAGLLDKLERFLMNGKQGDGVWLGDVSEHKNDMVNFFSVDDDMKQLVDIWMQKEKIHNLVNIWMNGFEVNWEKYYENKDVHRISLPTYVFAKEKYWIPKENRIKKKVTTEPVVKQQVSSDLPAEEGIKHAVLRELSSILGIHTDKIHTEVDFMDYGFDSIKAIRLANFMKQQYNQVVSVKEIMDAQNVNGLLELLEQRGIYEAQENETVVVEELPVKEMIKEFPLSESQKGIWMSCQAKNSPEMFNIPKAFKIQKLVDADILKEAFTYLMNFHYNLKVNIAYTEEGEVVQTVSPVEKEFFVIQDLSELSEDEVITYLRQLVIKEFDIESDSLIRVYYCMRKDYNILLINMHHLVFDGSSLVVMVRDLQRIYHQLLEGKVPVLKPLTETYADYVFWQQSSLDTTIAMHEGYWKDKLKSKIKRLERLGERSLEEDGSLKIYRKNLSEELSSKVFKLSHDAKKSLFAIMLGAYNAMLYRYENCEDVVVATAFQNREKAEYEELIGCFINMIVLRTKVLGEMTGEELLEATQKEIYESLEHGAYPYSEIMKEIRKNQNDSKDAIQVGFLVHNWFNDSDISSDTNQQEYLHLEYMEEINQMSEYGICIEVIARGVNICVDVKYDTAVISEDSVAKMMGYYCTLLEEICDDRNNSIENMRIVPDEEMDLMLNDWNNTNGSFPEHLCVQQLFEEKVKLYYNNTALIFKDEKLTYGEFNKRVNQLARKLRYEGVKPNDIVAVAFERSFEMLIALYAVIKAGGAYLPIVPSTLRERIDYLLENSKAKIVLCKNRDEFPYEADLSLYCLDELDLRQESDSDLECVNKPTDLIYVIYTSGSTGRPKGVMIEHRSLINRLLWTRKVHKFTHDDIIMFKTPYTFDCSVWELFCWFIDGIKISILNKDAEKNPDEIIENIEKNQVTLIHFVPSMLTIFLEYLSQMGGLEQITSIKRVFTTGEALTVSTVKLFNETMNKANGTKLMNLYGPTEATIEVSYYECPTDGDFDVIPIGKPMTNCQLYVVNKCNQMQPIGVLGELCIGGVCLARGYLNNQKQTQDKFVANPFIQGERMYKTGDLARFLPDGNIEFLGRADRQIKIRGVRIELGEIESAILEHPEIGEACVIVDKKRDMVGNIRLKAFYVAVQEKRIDSENIRSFLKDRLEDYMIPAIFAQIKAMPLTPHGKADFKKLEEYEEEDLHFSETFAEESDNKAETPESEEVEVNKEATIDVVREIFSELLEKEVEDDINFFDMGGHSMLLVKAAMQIKKKLNRNVKPAVLFRYPTVNSLASFLDGNTDSNNSEVNDAEDKSEDRRRGLKKQFIRFRGKK